MAGILKTDGSTIIRRQWTSPIVEGVSMALPAKRHRYHSVSRSFPVSHEGSVKEKHPDEHNATHHVCWLELQTQLNGLLRFFRPLQRHQSPRFPEMALRPWPLDLNDCFGIGKCGNEVATLEECSGTIGEHGGELFAQVLLLLPWCAL